jgi:hypothetical protein
MTAVDLAPVDRETTTRDRLSHIVEDRHKVRQAMIARFPVKALCGAVFVPTRWKPADFLKCQVCDMLARRRYPAAP